MAQLYNIQEGTTNPVHDNMVNELIRSGKYKFIEGEEIPMMDDLGNHGVLTAQEAYESIFNQDSGYSYLTKEVKDSKEVQAEYGDPLNQAAAAAEGFLRSKSLGTSDILLKEMGIPYRDIENRSKLTAGTMGEIGGYIPIPGLPLGFPSPLGVTEKAGKAVSKVAMEAIGKATGKKAKDTVARKMLKTGTEFGIRGATEAGIIEGSQAISQQIAKDGQLNAEAIIARTAHGIKMGAAFSSILGAGSEVAIKAAKTINDKVVKGLSKASGEKQIPLDLTLSKNIKKSNNQLADIPHLKLRKDAEKGVFTYSDLDKRIQIAENLEGKNVLNLNNSDDVITLGEKLNFSDLPDYAEVFSEKLGPSRSILKAYRSHVGKTAQTGISSIKLGKLTRNDKSLRAELGLLTQEAKIKGISPSLAAKRSALVKKINKNKLSMSIIQEKIKREAAKRLTKKGILKSLKEYDAIQIGDDLYVLNPGKFDDIKTNSFSTGKVTEKLKRSPEFALRSLGARTTEFRNLAKKGDKHINDVGDFVLDSYVQASGGNKLKGLQTSLDEVFEVMENRQLQARANMDSSIAELTNELERQGLDAGIKLSDVSSFIKAELLTSVSNPKTGKVFPGYESVYNQLDSLADSYNRYNRPEVGRELMLSPTDFRKLRMSIDNLIDYKNMSATDGYRLKIRREMEEMLVSRMENLDHGGELVNFYKEGKRTYGLAADALEVAKKGLERERSNNKIGLTAYQAGGTGAIIGGMLGGGPGAVVGSLAGTAAREFSRTRGDLFVALYGEKLFSSANGIRRRIKSSVNGFFKAPSAGLILPVVSMDSEYLQNSYRKDFSSFKYDPEGAMDDFYAENQGLVQLLPDHTNDIAQTFARGDAFLREKLPKNPYPSNYFKSYTPSEMELRKFERYKKAVASPIGPIDEISKGTISNESLESLKVVYPGIFEAIKQEFIDQMDKIKPDYRKRIQLDKMFGIKGDFYLEKQNIEYLQQSARLIQEREDEKKSLAGGKLNVDNRNMTDAQAIGQA